MSYQEQKFTEIANAIREKKGTSDLIKPSKFAEEIAAIETGAEKKGEEDLYPEDFLEGPQDEIWMFVAFNNVIADTKRTVGLYKQTFKVGAAIDWGVGSPVDAESFFGVYAQQEYDYGSNRGNRWIKIKGVQEIVRPLVTTPTRPIMIKVYIGADIRINSSVTDLFNACSSLCDIFIRTKKYVSTSVIFSGCENLIRITADLSHLTAFGSYAFRNCQSLTEISVPPNIQTVGTGCFQDTRLVRHIDLSNTSHTTLNSYLFQRSGVKQVKLPQTLVQISGSYTFSRTSIPHLRIPQGVTQVTGNYCFEFMKNSTVEIEGDIQRLSGTALFRNVDNFTLLLPNVTTVTTISANPFASGQSFKIYVPQNLLASFKAATNWVTIANNIYAIEEYTP